MERLRPSVSILFIAGLLLVMSACSASSDTPPQKPRFSSVSLSAFEALQYDWPDGRIVVSREMTSMGEEYRVVHRKRISASPRTDVPGAGSTPAENQTIAPKAKSLSAPVHFPAGPVMRRALEAFLHLRSPQHLGVPSRQRLVRMGLERPQRQLRVRGGGKNMVLELGNRSEDLQGRYMRRQGAPDVYVLPADVWRGFEGGALRLIDAKLVKTPIAELTGFSIIGGGGEYTWSIEHPGSPERRYVATGAHADDKEANVDELVSSLTGLRARTYFSEPDVIGLDPIATFVFQGAGGRAEKLVLYRDQARRSGVSACRGWWADIDLNRVQQIETMLRKLLH